MSKYKIQSTTKECDMTEELPPIRNQNDSMNPNENKKERIEKVKYCEDYFKRNDLFIYFVIINLSVY